MKFKEFYTGRESTILLGIFVGIIVFLLAGCVLFPSIFYDNFIWKYYWGPTVADAGGGTAVFNGVSAGEGYTIVSEITYGLILIVALYYIYRLLKKLNITIDWHFALALMPYIVFGPVSRVLEDSYYFAEPYVYYFISPFIYAAIAAHTIFFLVVGWHLKNKSDIFDKKYHFVYPIFVIIVVNVAMVALWTFSSSDSLSPVEPVIFYLVSLVSILPIIYSYKKKDFTINKMVLSGGILLLMPSLYLVSKWIFGYYWDITTGVRFDVFVLVASIVGLVCIAVYLISYKFRDNEKIKPYTNLLNISILAGHMLDGVTSYISIKDPLGMGLHYVEKHPASDALLNIWGPLFPIVKFVLIIVVIYVFDVLYKDELKNYARFVNLIKIGILILGLSPGLRDLLRVTMGV